MQVIKNMHRRYPMTISASIVALRRTELAEGHARLSHYFSLVSTVFSLQIQTSPQRPAKQTNNSKPTEDNCIPPFLARKLLPSFTMPRTIKHDWPAHWHSPGEGIRCVVVLGCEFATHCEAPPEQVTELLEHTADSNRVVNTKP